MERDHAILVVEHSINRYSKVSISSLPRGWAVHPIVNFSLKTDLVGRILQSPGYLSHQKLLSFMNCALSSGPVSLNRSFRPICWPWWVGAWITVYPVELVKKILIRKVVCQGACLLGCLLVKPPFWLDFFFSILLCWAALYKGRHLLTSLEQNVLLRAF